QLVVEEAVPRPLLVDHLADGGGVLRRALRGPALLAADVLAHGSFASAGGRRVRFARRSLRSAVRAISSQTLRRCRRWQERQTGAMPASRACQSAALSSGLP